VTEPIRFARNSDGESVAYQVTGDGPLTIVFIPDWGTNLDIWREDPSIDRFLNQLAAFSRLVCFDKRGTGLSDPVSLGAIPTPEEWMDDVRTVLDDLSVDDAAIFGHGEGGTMAIMFAASHPNRTNALILGDSAARRRRAPDYPPGIPEPIASQLIQYVLDGWGKGTAIAQGAPSLAGNPKAFEYRARLERNSMSPKQFSVTYPGTYEHDLRPLLEAIQAPTLVLHRAGNIYMRVDNGQYLAEHIEGAQLVELAGRDHFFHAGDTAAYLGAVQEFLTGTRESPDHDRVLATVLFTDIVGSTELAARLGDQGWRDLIDRHHELVRAQLKRFRGQEVDTAGDGFFATFDGPARGVRCALAIRDVVRSLGVEIRAGLHIGECELMGEKVGGIAVHIGARVMAAADPGAVWVSRTVKDLVAGSGLVFESRGNHEFKGVAGDWELFAAS
jgi:pimeloyl-ACP methyl ester carboxylesterase